MIIKGRAHTHNVISFMNLSLFYFIWNSSENFPIKSVFRKLIKMLCWLWIFTYVTMFIPSYSNIPNCFTEYEGKCNYGKNYIGETGRNVTVRWDEHSDIGKNSEPAKHLNQFPEHRFNWKILRRVPNKVRQRKIDEAYYVYAPYP